MVKLILTFIIFIMFSGSLLLMVMNSKSGTINWVTGWYF